MAHKDLFSVHHELATLQAVLHGVVAQAALELGAPIPQEVELWVHQLLRRQGHLRLHPETAESLVGRADEGLLLEDDECVPATLQAPLVPQLPEGLTVLLRVELLLLRKAGLVPPPMLGQVVPQHVKADVGAHDPILDHVEHPVARFGVGQVVPDRHPDDLARAVHLLLDEGLEPPLADHVPRQAADVQGEVSHGRVAVVEFADELLLPNKVAHREDIQDDEKRSQGVEHPLRVGKQSVVWQRVDGHASMRLRSDLFEHGFQAAHRLHDEQHQRRGRG
mmetsp:Transcript_132439/g.382848  ORF Transcript_132439/g.382848 Transcript_132439/m.382848 type:complete len:278 (-) Transcript_132439:575-1408(-)